MQDATNREVISGLNKQIEDIKARMVDCDRALSTTRANEDQLKEQNMSLQAKIVTLEKQSGSIEQTSEQLTQLRADLGLKVATLDKTKSELDAKTGELRKLNTTNDELRSHLNELQEQLDAAPSAEAERKRLEEKHREDLETFKQNQDELYNDFRENEMANAANELQKMTSDHKRACEKLNEAAKQLDVSKQNLEKLSTDHASVISNMKKRIESADKIAADRKKEIDTLRSTLQSAQKASDEAGSLASQLANEKEALRKAVQEKDLLVEQMGQHRHKHTEDLNRLNQALRQCRTDGEETKKGLEAEVHAAEERGTLAIQQMQHSTEQRTEAEKAECEKRLEALQKSLQESQATLKSQIEQDQKFREEIESEEEKNQATIAELNNKILEAETQRDDAFADNEHLREDLAKAHNPKVTPSTDTASKATMQPPEVTNSKDPRLQNRHSQPDDTSLLRAATVPSQELRATDGIDRPAKKVLQANSTFENIRGLGNVVSARGHIVEESQSQSQSQMFQPSNYSHTQNGSSSREEIPSSRTFGGSTMNDSQQCFSAVSQLQNDGTQPGHSLPSERNRGPVVDESQLQSYGHFSNQPAPPTIHVESTQRAQDNTRGPVVEETQDMFFPSSQHFQHSSQGHTSLQQSLYTTQYNNFQFRARKEAESDMQIVPETQYDDTDSQASKPLFANFNAEAEMRKGKYHDLLSDPFDNTSTGNHALRNVPPRFRKPAPPPNTASKMVRPSTGSSSLSSLPSDGDMPSSSAAVAEKVSKTVHNFKTPESRSMAGQPRPTTSTPSVSSPGFVEQMAKGRSQNTYRAGASGNKSGGGHHSNHKEPRAAAPKRKAQSQVVGGYEQERKKKQAARGSEGDGHSLSELVASQNRGLRASGSSRATPRAATQPSRMQTFAGASSTSIRQTRNATRKLSKGEFVDVIIQEHLLILPLDEEINARFSQELGPAR